MIGRGGRRFAAALAIAIALHAAGAKAHELDATVVPVTHEGTLERPLGGNEFVAQLTNRGATAVSGEVRLIHGNSDPPHTTRAPFRVAANASATIRIGFVAMDASGTRVELRTDDGEVRELASYAGSTSDSVTIFDASKPSRLRATIEGLPIAADYAPLAFGHFSGPTSPAGARLRVARATIEAASGATVFPTFVGAWAGVHLAVIPSAELLRASPEELEALSGYVLGGGSLAIPVVRPDDLRHPTIASFVGGVAAPTAAGSELVAPIALPFDPAAARAARSPSTATPTPSPVEQADPTLAPLPSPGPGSAPPTALPFPFEAMPAASTTLTSYAGGNLAPSAFGATAPYGLGEVTLLGFDLARPAVADDPWVRWRIVELARRAHDRRLVSVAMPAPETLASDASNIYGPSRNQSALARVLDPNRSARWGVGVGALLLCLYAVVAGPVLFLRAAKKNRPLDAMIGLPILSAITFTTIVVLGLVARGTSTTARRLTFIDAAAGMDRGVAVHERAFYSTSTQRIDVAALRRTSLLGVDGRDVPARSFVVDRDGMRVTELEATPSQTLVIEDQGIAPLGRGIAIERDTGGELFVTNATGRALRSVVLSMPDGSVRSTPRIGPGERVRSSDLDRAKGDLVQWRSTQTETRFGTALVRHLESPYLVAAFEELDGRALGDAWQAVSDASCRASSWFPSGVPVVLAELAPEPGRRVDAGRAVDQETTLVRVVGWGGLAP